MNTLATFAAGALAACVALRRVIGARVSRGVRLTIRRQERKLRVRRAVLLEKIVVALVIIGVVLWLTAVTS